MTNNTYDKVLDDFLTQMELTSFVESIHYSNKLEGINVPIDRCYELVIGTYDTTD
jgi:hypothetical protein